MARVRYALLGLAVAAAACRSAAPPAELSGLWSSSQAACEAGVGVRFGADAIRAMYDGQSEVLFRAPRYEAEGNEADFRVRIRYALPRPAGGAHSQGAHGMIVLARSPGGGLAPRAHNLLDARTGAARLRVMDDPAAALLTLEPCGPHPWREGIRGRQLS